MSDSNQLPSVTRIKRDGTFNRFADKNFNPNVFTSEILSSENGDRQGMDIDMCMKMLSIYLDTIDSDLRDIVLQNQDKLFNQISDIKGLKSEYEGICNKVDVITSKFERIKNDVSSSCKSINENSVRLENSNTVVLILRQITSFRSGIKKIKGFLTDDNPTQRSWLRAQKTYQEIEKVFLEDIRNLADDVKYYTEIRAKIMEHVVVKN